MLKSWRTWPSKRPLFGGVLLGQDASSRNAQFCRVKRFSQKHWLNLTKIVTLSCLYIYIYTHYDNICMSLCLCLSVCLSLSQSLCCLSIYQSTYLPIYLLAMSLSLSLSLSLCPPLPSFYKAKATNNSNNCDFL